MKKTDRQSKFSGGPVFCCLLLALAAILGGGCTARERAGYSSIPQNSPSSWSMHPYGEIRN